MYEKIKEIFGSYIKNLNTKRHSKGLIAFLKSVSKSPRTKRAEMTA
jgi:hypothetical protein